MQTTAIGPISPVRSYTDEDALLILLAAFFCCSALFFGIVQIDADIGRDFVVPDLALQGRLFYRDLMYIFGPFAPSFDSLLFRIWGPSMTVLLIAGALASLAIVLVSYLLARQILSPGAATIAALIVITHAVYRPGLMSYATPYTFAGTYGLLFSLLALYSASRALDERYSSWDFVTGGAAALALASKQEFAVIALFTLLAGLAVRAYRAGGLLPRAMLASAIPFVAITAAFAVFLFHDVTLTQFLANVYPRDLIAALRYLYQQFQGWGPQAWKLFRNTSAGFLLNFAFIIWATCGVVTLFGIARRLVGRPPWAAAGPLAGFGSHANVCPEALARGKRPSGKLVLFLLLGAVGVAFAWQHRDLRYFPLLLHAIVLVVALGRERGSRRTKILFLTFCAAVFLMRILPKSRLELYGVQYFIPSLVIYLYLCYNVVAPSLAGFVPQAPIPAAMTAVFAFFFVSYPFINNVQRWSRKSEHIETERGTIRVLPEEAAKARVMLEEIRRYSSPKDRILLIPYGTLYYFLTDRQPVSRYLDYQYGNLIDGEPEREEIRQLIETSPRLIIIDDIRQWYNFPGPVNRFGEAYNVELDQWIRRHYRLVRTIRYRGRPVRFLIPQGS